jgi:3-deoxy-D-manno-octulosonate 8-phosphate phosphatase (KDO 8-P phosphatase)
MVTSHEAIGSTLSLAPERCAARARRVRVVLTDCDGVLTDAGVYYGPDGTELRRFSVRDGLGFERLAQGGVRVAIVSGERSACIARRAEKLGVPSYLGVADKGHELPRIAHELGVSIDETAYFGDDRNDLEAMRLVAEGGLTACPADAAIEVVRASHRRAERPGGHGAFRELAEWLLALRAS